MMDVSNVRGGRKRKKCEKIIKKKLTHIVYYNYQQRSLQRWVLTRNSSNSRLTSLKYFYEMDDEQQKKKYLLRHRLDY